MWEQGRAISSDELTTSTATALLPRDMDAAYTLGAEAFLSAPAQRTRLLGELYTNVIPNIDAQLLVLQQMHRGDPPDEHAGIGLGTLLLRRGIRRVRLAVEPSEEQVELADTLQIANSEGEAHELLRRHLERILPSTIAVVLNRNNSADRLEAVTPLPGDSPLGETLRGAKPRSCLTVRSPSWPTYAT
jgi:hypothetical protein